MRSYKKYIPYISVLIIIIFFAAVFLSRPTININDCSAENAYNTIKELSSDKYKGRLFGSEGNEAAAAYIENQFKSIGLKPAGADGTYRTGFNEITKSFSGKAVLELLDKNGNVVKEYKYGEDFIEQNYGLSIAGDVTSGWKYVSLSDLSEAEDCGTNEIAVIRGGSFNDYYSQMHNYSYLHGSKFKALIRLVNDDFNLRYTTGTIRGLNLHRSGYEMPTIIAKASAAKDLYDLENKGYRIHLKSNFNIEPKKISNVLGMIPGKGDEYLFITAHLDHVGPDSDGTIYPGALDNASGVSAMLEIARFVKSQNIKPQKNIVFAAFNAEEGGLRGSYDYILHPLYPLYKTTVLNMDMVGSDRKIPLTIAYNTIYYGNRDPSQKLRFTLKGIGGASGLDIAETNSESSDHAIFSYYGVPAVTLIDYDTSRIHTPKDTIDHIGKDNLDRALKIVVGFVALNAYSNYSVNGFSMVKIEIINYIKAQYPLILLLLLTAFVFYKKYKYSGRDKQPGKNSIPVLSVITTIIVSSIIIYFPVNSQSATFGSESALKLVAYGTANFVKSLLFSPYLVLFMIPGLLALWICHSRIHSWSYQGEGREFNTVYKFSMASVVLTSLYYVFMYNTPLYMALAPEFARSIFSKIIVNLVIALIAFGIYKIFCLEVNIKTKGFKNFIAFSLILFILLSSFYTPIFVNGRTFSANSSSVNISDFSSDTEGSGISNK